MCNKSKAKYSLVAASQKFLFCLFTTGQMFENVIMGTTDGHFLLFTDIL